MRNNWMKLTDFNHKHGLNRNHIHTVKHQRNPSWIMTSKQSHSKVNLITVNDGFLMRIEAFRESMEHEGQELYYWLLENGYNQSALAKQLSINSKHTFDTWNNWLQTTLFKTLDPKMTILFTTIKPMLIELVRKGRRLKAR